MVSVGLISSKISENFKLPSHWQTHPDFDRGTVVNSQLRLPHTVFPHVGIKKKFLGKDGGQEEAKPI